MVRIKNLAEGYIDYRLNIMGVRVWHDGCQLIAKKGEDWQTIGPRRALPVSIPAPSQAMQSVIDELRMTAFQFQMEHPDSDLATVLSQSKSFHSALENGNRGSKKA